jgi:hypothetical protein
VEPGAANGSARSPLLPVVFHHPIDDLHQMLAYLPHPDRLPARVGTVEHHGVQVRREVGILKSGSLAKADDAFVLSVANPSSVLMPLAVSP